MKLTIATSIAVARRARLNLLNDRRYIVRAARWFDVFKYAVIGATALVLAAPWLRRSLTTWFSDGSLPKDGALPLMIAVVVMFLAMLRARPVAVGKLRTALHFPPWWVAVFLAEVFALGYWRAVPPSWNAVMPGDHAAAGLRLVAIATGISTVAVVLLLIAWDWLRQRTRNVSRRTKSDDRNGWLLNDDPILSADEDLFGHKAIAGRIADRLSAASEPSAVAVIGGFGSGKSSVRNLTMERLQESPWVVVVPVSAWPYESATALVAGILERVVAELADRAGWEALRHVPVAYRQAVEGTAGSWGKLLRILERPRTPEALLQGIDDVAMALCIRLVVWVEDLERFAPLGDNETETPAVREKLEPVRALLHQLQELRNVTIVVATTRLDTGFDLEKLARFIEVLPSLSPELALEQLHKARSDAMARATACRLVDPVSPEQRSKLELRPAPSSLSALVRAAERALGRVPFQWADALVALSPTPRTVKQGLREFWGIWRALAGEIDVDHVLGASILRHSEPKVFQALVTEAAFFRTNDVPPNYEALLEEWGVRAERIEAVTFVLKYLFGDDSVQHSQGFGKIKPADYWARYLSRTPIDETDRDQPVLNALEAFAANDSSPLVEMSMQGQAGGKIRAFESLLPTPKVLDLLDAQLRWLQENHFTWLDDNFPHGLNDTWLICIRRAEQGGWSAERAFAIVDEHVQASVRGHNLRLADWLLGFGMRDSEQIAERLSPEHRDELRRKFVESFVETFANDPDALAEALKDVADSSLLHRLCFDLHRSRNSASGVPFTEWPQFSISLQAAARSYPRWILPQLSHFLTTSQGRNGFITRINRNAVSQLFPGTKVLSLFAQHPEVEVSDRVTQARLIALRTAAQPPDAAVVESGRPAQ